MVRFVGRSPANEAWSVIEEGTLELGGLLC